MTHKWGNYVIIVSGNDLSPVGVKLLHEPMMKTMGLISSVGFAWQNTP